MTKIIPNYLRVHRGPRRANDTTSAEQAESIESFWIAYTDATGWRVDRPAARLDGPMNVLPAPPLDLMADADASQAIPAVSQSSACRLAEAASRLATQLNEARAALRRQEAELAARAAVVIGSDNRERLADRIESTLRSAASACDCDAAAMYLLDDDTIHLKARGVYGLPADRLEQRPRELKGSRGDLEALVQGVVTIDEFGAGSIDTWSPPEPFASGICASINNASVPIGTMWLFCRERRSFTGAHAAAARMAAAQLSTELASAVVDRTQSLRRKSDEAIRDVSHWQFETLPVGSTLADGWLVDGMVESAEPWSTGWHSWDVLPDGTLMVAIAEAKDEAMSGALTATLARAAMTAHCGYRHTPAQMMQRVNDSLWQTSTGDQLTSMMYLHVNPDSGDGEIASAGRISAMIVNHYGYRPLVDGHNEPLTSHIDARYSSATFRILPGETLLAYGPGFEADGAGQTMLGNQVRGCMERSETNPLAAIRRATASLSLNHERGAVTLLRR